MPSWKDFPSRVKAVEAFSKQPSLTREEQIAQTKRNHAELAARKEKH